MNPGRLKPPGPHLSRRHGVHGSQYVRRNPTHAGGLRGPPGPVRGPQPPLPGLGGAV